MAGGVGRRHGTGLRTEAPFLHATQGALSADAVLEELGLDPTLRDQLRRLPVHPVQDESTWHERLLAAALCNLDGPSGERRLAIAAAAVTQAQQRPPYGRLNRLGLDHPLAQALPVLRSILSRPAADAGGSLDTINRQAGSGGGQTAPLLPRRLRPQPARYRNPLMSCPPGQSGHQASPFHYADEWTADGVPPASPFAAPPATTLRLRPRP